MSGPLTPPGFYEALFKRGLGELLMMRHKDAKVFIGNLVMDKGTLVFKDRGLLEGVSPAAVAPCWNIGIVGAVCDVRGNEWDSLTFLGPDHCKIPVDLSSTRHGLLRGIKSATGENVLIYRGSVYRGFKLMLDAYLLPLVLPMPIDTHDEVIGLAVTDFRFAAAPIDLLSKLNDLVRASVERYLSLTVEDLDLGEDEFENLFASYLKKD